MWRPLALFWQLCSSGTVSHGFCVEPDQNLERFLTTNRLGLYCVSIKVVIPFIISSLVTSVIYTYKYTVYPELRIKLKPGFSHPVLIQEPGNEANLARSYDIVELKPGPCSRQRLSCIGSRRH